MHKRLVANEHVLYFVFWKAWSIWWTGCSNCLKMMLVEMVFRLRDSLFGSSTDHSPCGFYAGFRLQRVWGFPFPMFCCFKNVSLPYNIPIRSILWLCTSLLHSLPTMEALWKNHVLLSFLTKVHYTKTFTSLSTYCILWFGSFGFPYMICFES